MNTLVIADLHLRRNDSRKDIIIDFLRNIATKFDRMIILGDFFEFWYGFDNFIIPDYKPILSEFAKLTEDNTEIIYIEGNHDFCLGNHIKQLGIIVKEEKYEFMINNKKFIAVHGDTVNIKNDKFYKILRKFLRSRFTKFLMNTVPPNIILKIADKSSQTSRKYLFKEHNLKQIIDSFKEKKNYDLVISGHFHCNFSYNDFYILGDWSKDYNYLTIDNNGDIKYNKFTL